MAKKRSKRRVRAPRGPRVWRWTGLFLVAVGVFLAAALLTYRHEGATGLFAGVWSNAGGAAGVWLAGHLLRPLGWVAVWLVPGLAVAFGLNRLRLAPPGGLALRAAVAVPAVLAFTALLSAFGAGPGFAGAWAHGLWSGIRGAIGPVGGFLLVAVASFGFLLLEAEVLGGRWASVAHRTLRALGALLTWALRHAVTLPVRAARAWWDQVTAAWQDRAAEEPNPDREPEPVAPRLRAVAAADPEPVAPRIVDPGEDLRLVQASRVEPPAPVAPAAPAASALSTAPPARVEEDAVVRRVAEGTTGAEDVGNVVEEAKRANRKSGKVTPRALFRTLAGKFTLPTPDLLDDVPEAGPSVPEDELMENSRVLTETLRDFGIQGRVGEVHPGPVITRYEFTPGPGVRVAQIVNRAEDLALKLRAMRIRIVAPIPGKAAVGIEVPNKEPQTIYLKRLLQSTAFTSEKAGPLPLALGKDINGFPVVAELTRMPHLLVAGTTGSGKSVCVNGIISSLLMKHSPENLRLLMVDPKMLELPMYNGIPHLLTDVVTDPKLAARALKWLILEMERRYQVLAARGSRNIQSYNEKMDREGAVHEGEEKLPFIVAVIDELADLMMTSGKEVEEPIARLAQMARAVGIHLIVATQRPSVDVLTGVIKANFPTRIAFQVASKTDSRTILDQNGAETLLGRGDMLFLPPGKAQPERVHGAFVTEHETQSLVHFLKEQGVPSADIGLEEALAETETRAGEMGDDPLFEDAARVVVAAGQGSASLLQRRLKVGYARAGRLVDMLESAGVVAPADGSKPREVMLDDVRLEQMLRERDE